MRKSLKLTRAAALLACVCAPHAAAQEAPPQPAKPGDAAVRVRRVEAAESRDAKDEPKAAGDKSKEPLEKSADKPAVTSSDKSADKASDKMSDKSDESRDEAAGAASVEEDAEVEALRAKAEAAASPLERGRLRLALAERLAGSGRRAEATDVLRAVLSEERFDPQLFYNTGNAFARLGESESAADAYRKAVAQRRGNYSRAQHNLGVVLTRLGRWEEAEEALRAALRLESNTYAEASYSLGRLHSLRGESALAEAEWERTLRLRPDHADAAAALARSVADGGDADRALALLDAFATRAKSRGTETPREVTVARGEIVAAANVAAVRRASGDAGLRAETRAASGSKPAGAESVSDSLELLSAPRARRGGGAAPVVDKQSYALLRGARSARASSRDEEAVALYRRAIRGGGGYLAPANMELGFTLSAMRRHEEAAEALLAVVRNDGGRYPLAFYHLGRIYEQLGRLGEAGEA